tara:strand:- start:641 stop:1798 length:1158 start_codon:yes stop_codon:yes gene_type:complete
MKIKNNFKNLKFKKNYFQDYSINEFMGLSMFNPITQKDYFSQYDLNKFKKKNHRVHVFGMGGSSLSSKLLALFIDPKVLNESLFIYDNPSLVNITSTINRLKLSKNDKFIFISKSGDTIETKYFLHLVMKILKNKKISYFYNQFIFITENKNSYLKNFALDKNILCFDHDPYIGGRFSIFSITSLLPLIAMGYSLSDLLKSFKSAKDKFLKNHKKLAKTILSILKYEDFLKINNIVGLSYHDRIHSINEWYRQIFAESLGKNKKAKNYISAYGSIDQHSQFQLFIDGPKDKHFLFFSVANKATKISNNKELIRGYNLISILEKGAIKTLEQKNFLVNQIIIQENLSDYSFLLFYLIFDIYLRAKVSNINFLDQPGVEILKKNTRA